MAKPVAAGNGLDQTLDASSMRTMVSMLEKIKDLGDGESWSGFYKRYHSLVRAMAWSFIRTRNLPFNEQDVEDIVIEVMEGFSRQIGEFEYKPGKRKFRGYLVTMTRRRCIDLLRRRMARPPSAAAQQAPDDGLEPEISDDDDATGDISRLIEQHDMEVGRILALEKLRHHPRVTTAQYQIFEQLARVVPVATVCAQLGVTANQVLITRSRVLPHYEQALRQAKEDLDRPTRMRREPGAMPDSRAKTRAR